MPDPTVPRSGAGRQLLRSPAFAVGMVLLAGLAVMAAAPRLLVPAGPGGCDPARRNRPPGPDAWFGVDPQGCDYYATVASGARTSLAAAGVVVAATVVVALVMGVLAGYRGGRVDALVSRLAALAAGLPMVLAAVLLAYGLRDRLVDTTPTGDVPRGFVLVVVALAAVGWVAPLRAVRSRVVAGREADHVLAARALGARRGRILRRHVLPDVLAPLLVVATRSVGVGVAAEAALSFLGVGLQAPAVSWGLQLGQAQQQLGSAPWLLLFPGLCVLLTVLAFALVGTALRRALDPPGRGEPHRGWWP